MVKAKATLNVSLLGLVPYFCLQTVLGFVNVSPSRPFLPNSYSRCSSASSAYRLCRLEAQKQSKLTDGAAAILDEEEKAADITGAKFFGGDSIKDELFDEKAEMAAGTVVFVAEEEACYNRFLDTNAFPDDTARNVAQDLQSQINTILYEESDKKEGATASAERQREYEYSISMNWETPMSVDKSSTNPLKELEKALTYYNRVDIAVVSARSSGAIVTANWEISVTWPNLWESSVVLTGTSALTLDNDKIVKQVDELNDNGKNDVYGTIFKQCVPRFWDLYHIGMTPSAELGQRLPSSAKRGLFSSYEVFEIPPRLVLKPTLVDTLPREEGCAQIIPNHAFSTLIKTAGRERQRYITTSPVEVQIARGDEESRQLPKLSWTIPLAVEIQTNAILPSADNDDENAPEEAMPGCTYEFENRRRVATLPYGGSPQDTQVSDIRKKLYDQVIRDGHKPKLDNGGTGRPIFFFLQHDAKACYTEQGLGMAVYDWRPNFTKGNEVGIELEL